jgi:transcriptional/translational regulatory protein YebC/TACO1
VFSRLGGSLAEPGAVSWQFQRRGIVLVNGTADEEAVLAAGLEAGADDISDDGGTWRVVCDPSSVFEVREALVAAGLDVVSADSQLVSDHVVPVSTVEDARSVLRILEAIEDNDDVQDVFSNFDIPDDIMEAAAS